MKPLQIPIPDLGSTELNGARKFDPSELNALKFSDRQTVLTLRKLAERKG